MSRAEVVELLGTADPALARDVRARGRKPVVAGAATDPASINGIEVVAFTGAQFSGAYRLSSADPAEVLAARKRGQRPILVVDAAGAVVPP